MFWSRFGLPPIPPPPPFSFGTHERDRRVATGIAAAPHENRRAGGASAQSVGRARGRRGGRRGAPLSCRNETDSLSSLSPDAGSVVARHGGAQGASREEAELLPVFLGQADQALHLLVVDADRLAKLFDD